VEQALCDLASRRAGEPLWKWLGGAARSALPLYANINRVVGPRLPEDVAAAGAAAVGSGFATVKCAPFDVPLAGYWLGEAGLARLRALRSAVGADVSIYVDCHERLAQDDVLKILPEMDGLDVAWLEDATACTDLTGLRALRSVTAVPLAGGEIASTPEEIRPAVEHRLLDVVMPDVKHAGGVLRAAQLAAAVPEAQISPHNPSGPIATAVSAHLAAALPNFSVLEYAHGEVEWRADIVGGAETVIDGHLHLTDMPGLGVELLTAHSALHHVRSLTVEEKLCLTIRALSSVAVDSWPAEWLLAWGGCFSAAKPRSTRTSSRTVRPPGAERCNSSRPRTLRRRACCRRTTRTSRSAGRSSTR
jgi:galactonate dehydratase